MKPLIGVISRYEEPTGNYWSRPGYIEGMEEAGAVPLLLPLTENPSLLGRFTELCDGFLFPGGQDLAPALYGEEKSQRCEDVVEKMDGGERALFPLALKTGKPLLGVCRGLQLFNVLLGGTLYQDFPTERPGSVIHRGKTLDDEVRHPVSVLPDTLLAQILGAGEIEVNSYHHQAVKELGKGLKLAAVSPDGLIEAAYLPDHPFALAVQWHPELIYKNDGNSRKIFHAFARACAGFES